MLNVSANSDFIKLDTTIDNPFYDISWKLDGTSVYGINAINQAIDNLLLTEPGERLFNTSFYSPLFDLLHMKASIAQEELKTNVFDIIEKYVQNITIDRDNADIQTDNYNNSISFKLSYTTSTGEYGKYSRVIGL